MNAVVNKKVPALKFVLVHVHEYEQFCEYKVLGITLEKAIEGRIGS